MTSFFGILLALLCALATNVGFLYKHRGACAAPAVDMRRPLVTAKALFASPLFTIGWVIGAGAWVFHVGAMSVAPLSLVQAVLAGGMVLLAIMAEQMLGCHIGRRQWIGLGLTAFGLMLLGFTLPLLTLQTGYYGTPTDLGSRVAIADLVCLASFGLLCLHGSPARIPPAGVLYLVPLAVIAELLDIGGYAARACEVRSTISSAHCVPRCVRRTPWAHSVPPTKGRVDS